MFEWRDFLFVEGGADRDRAVAGKVQHAETALGAGLSSASSCGVRAAKRGSPVAYGFLRAALCIIARGCDVNSLTRRGTKTRAGHSLERFVGAPVHFFHTGTDLTSTQEVVRNSQPAPHAASSEAAVFARKQ